MNELSKHTPAPWLVKPWESNDSQFRAEIQFGDDGECVSDCVYSLKDAQLIAAAPEMLEALKNLKESTRTTMLPSSWEQVNEAISKAEG